MKNLVFSRTLGISATFALSGLTFLPAQAVETSPAPSATAISVEEQIPATQKYDYVSAGDQDVHDSYEGTLTPIILVREDGTEVTIPLEETTFELLDVPAGIELSVDQNGVISYRIQGADSEGTFAFKMKMTYADGSSETDDYCIIYHPNPYMWLDSQYSGPSENLQVGQKYTLTPELWTVGMLSERVPLPTGYYVIDKTSDNISATINSSTGAVTFEFVKGNPGDSGTMSVTMRDENGYVLTYNIERMLGLVIPMQDKINPSYEEGNSVDILAGQTYKLTPSYSDFTSEAYNNNKADWPPPVAGIPEGTTVSLVQSSPELTMSVDSQTGVVSYSLAELPKEETTYSYTLLWTFADGSSTEYDGYLTVKGAQAISQINDPAPGSETDSEEPTSTQEDTHEAISGETSESALASVATSAPSVTDSSQVSSPSENAVVTSPQLAHTGAHSALFIFLAGLAMLGAGTTFVVSRYKN